MAFVFETQMARISLWLLPLYRLEIYSGLIKFVEIILFTNASGFFNASVHSILDRNVIRCSYFVFRCIRSRSRRYLYIIHYVGDLDVTGTNEIFMRTRVSTCSPCTQNNVLLLQCVPLHEAVYTHRCTALSRFALRGPDFKTKSAAISHHMPCTCTRIQHNNNITGAFSFSRCFRENSPCFRENGSHTAAS